jgi:hypothetical protein
MIQELQKRLASLAKQIDSLSQEREELVQQIANASIVKSSASITVTKGDQQVFKAEAGRLGCADSARYDFLCFASGVIGASYTVMEDAAKRISEFGYVTVFNPS